MGRKLSSRSREIIKHAILVTLRSIEDGTSRDIFFYIRKHNLIPSNLSYGVNRLSTYLTIMEKEGIIKKRKIHMKTAIRLNSLVNLWSLA